MTDQEEQTTPAEVPALINPVAIATLVCALHRRLPPSIADAIAQDYARTLLASAAYPYHVPGSDVPLVVANL